MLITGFLLLLELPIRHCMVLLKLPNIQKLRNWMALVIAPPYYVPISQEEMREYLENIAPKLPLPFLMYDMPSCTKMHMSLETIKKAKDLGAIGIKDSSGDMSYLYSLIQEFKGSPEFSIIAGTELFLPEPFCREDMGLLQEELIYFPGYS